MVTRLHRAAFLFVAATLAVSLPACRKVGKDIPQQKFTLLKSSRDSEWYADGPAGTGRGSADSVILPVFDGPPDTVDVLIEPEDTLDLYAKWAKRPLADLMRLNPDVSGKGLVAGEVFRFVMTPGELGRFNGARNGYLISARSRKDGGVASVLRHTVSEGETLKDLLARYATSLDMLEKLNPTIQLTGVRPGQVLNIPILSGGTPKPSSLPGPRPPSPPPVPVPPQDPRPLTADSPTPAPVAPAPASQPAAAAPVVVPAPAPAPVVAAAKAPAPAPAADGAIYQVKEGDNAWIIARKRLNISPDALAAANPGVDLNRIRPGQKLKIPR